LSRRLKDEDAVIFERRCKTVRNAEGHFTAEFGEIAGLLGPDFQLALVQRQVFLHGVDFHLGATDAARVGVDHQLFFNQLEAQRCLRLARCARKEQQREEEGQLCGAAKSGADYHSTFLLIV
jgi:hypothetical protein